jgi:hypothetical protein
MSKTTFMKNLILITALTFLIGKNVQALPLTLTEFNGQFFPTNSVMLNWNTMVEINTDYFTVQRSTDGINFQDLAQVNSKSSDTSTVYQINYTYTDQTPLGGTSYYRLQITDKDGTTTHSVTVQLSNDRQLGIKIFPTVVQSSSLFVQSDKDIRNAKLEIFDLSGKKIVENNWDVLSGNQSVTLKTSSYVVKGAYLARLTSNGEQLINQLIVIQAH